MTNFLYNFLRKTQKYTGTDKGNYKKALSGQIANFIGLATPYEPPLNPEIIIETNKEDILQCTQKIISSLKNLGYLD